jgi:peptide subunit release factor 1 (eRF1)
MKTKKNQKQVSKEEYIESYCQEKRIRERFAVYVSPETHHNIRTVARLFASEYYTTTSSLADSILSRHFEEHRELLNEEQKEYNRKVFAWIKDKEPGTSEEPEGQPDDADNTAKSAE